MYKHYRISDPLIQTIFLAACDTKNRLWQMFFGWRRTYANGDMDFLISKKMCIYLEQLAMVAEALFGDD